MTSMSTLTYAANRRGTGYAHSCTVTDTVWCTSGMALIQKLQCELPISVFLTSTLIHIWCQRFRKLSVGGGLVQLKGGSQ